VLKRESGVRPDIRSPPGVLSGLRADGEVLRWLHGGKERATPAH
jgi:hypothetical protein